MHEILEVFYSFQSTTHIDDILSSKKGKLRRSGATTNRFQTSTGFYNGARWSKGCLWYLRARLGRRMRAQGEGVFSGLFSTLGKLLEPGAPNSLARTGTARQVPALRAPFRPRIHCPAPRDFFLLRQTHISSRSCYPDLPPLVSRANCHLSKPVQLRATCHDTAATALNKSAPRCGSLGAPHLVLIPPPDTPLHPAVCASVTALPGLCGLRAHVPHAHGAPKTSAHSPFFIRVRLPHRLCVLVCAIGGTTSTAPDAARESRGPLQMQPASHAARVPRAPCSLRRPGPLPRALAHRVRASPQLLRTARVVRVRRIGYAYGLELGVTRVHGRVEHSGATRARCGRAAALALRAEFGQSPTAPGAECARVEGEVTPGRARGGTPRGGRQSPQLCGSAMCWLVPETMA
ncbi:hypothetical protein C8R44DRAFT_729331 [Mycena epipterygia]|nr:hypothetical protein C8R44DRAFT_729331 [Mycena epipterygia]